MKKLKNFFLIIATVFCVAISALFLTACGGNGGSSKVNGVYIKIDNEGMSNYYFIAEKYGIKVGDIYDRISFAYTYSNGLEKAITEDELKDMTITEKHSVDISTEGECIWQEITDDMNDATVLDVGNYQFLFTVDGYECELQICIMKNDEYQPNLSIAVLPNSANNYSQYYDRSAYKFGCPTAKNTYDESTYTSDYKVYVYDNDAHEVVSGTKVKDVYALPKIADKDCDTLTWYDDVNGTSLNYPIKEGDDLLQKYNAINAMNISDWNKKSLQNALMVEYSAIITVNNGKKYDDDTLVVNTENAALKPDQYYLIANYADENHEQVFTAPDKNKILTVQKGDFIWKNTITLEGQDYNENLATEFIESLSLNINYKFPTYFGDGEQPRLTTATQKALSLTDIGDIIPNSTFEDKKNAQGEDEKWDTYLKCSTFNGGRGVLGYVKFELTGKEYVEGDDFGKTISRLDCSDNGKILQAKVVIDDDYLKQFYNDDPTIYPVTVTINKGEVYKPIVSGDFIYNGKTQEPTITVNEKLYTITGTTSTTDVGEHDIVFKLKDSVNYYVENAGTGEDFTTGVKYSWNIAKITWKEPSEEFPNMEYTYNGQYVMYTSEMAYVNNVNTVVITLPNENYKIVKNAVKDKSPEQPIVKFELASGSDETFEDAQLTRSELEDGTLVLTFTFGSIKKELSSRPTVKITIEFFGTDVSNKFTPDNPIEITFTN